MSEHDQNTYLFTSESVSEGHPDKVADFLSDTVLDLCLEADPHALVACETLVKAGTVVLAGELHGANLPDATVREAAVRAAIAQIGYTDPAEAFHAASVRVLDFLGEQSGQIRRGVTGGGHAAEQQGAGDQGLMFGYATDETPERLPLPIALAHRLARTLAEDRHAGIAPWLRPDAKTQVTVRYDGITHQPLNVETVVVSAQHAVGTDQAIIRAYIHDKLLPRALGEEWHRPDIRLLVNPTGEFSLGGPSADCGVTGRKIIVDTYGGYARHGGGAFSGKDASKVDRSGAYFARYAARAVVGAEIARRCEIQVAYAIGHAEPVSLRVDTFGTGEERAAGEFVRREFDFRPAMITKRLGLRRPLYRQSTNYGHFGRTGLPWEETATTWTH